MNKGKVIIFSNISSVGNPVISEETHNKNPVSSSLGYGKKFSFLHSVKTSCSPSLPVPSLSDANLGSYWAFSEWLYSQTALHNYIYVHFFRIESAFASEKNTCHSFPPPSLLSPRLLQKPSNGFAFIYFFCQSINRKSFHQFKKITITTKKLHLITLAQVFSKFSVFYQYIWKNSQFLTMISNVPYNLHYAFLSKCILRFSSSIQFVSTLF